MRVKYLPERYVSFDVAREVEARLIGNDGYVIKDGSNVVWRYFLVVVEVVTSRIRIERWRVHFESKRHEGLEV